MKHFIRRRPGTLVIVWAVIIFILCAFPGEFIPSNNWLDLLSVDKLIHASIFFVMCFLFIGYVVNHGKQNLVPLFVIISILYGISLELMQGMKPKFEDWS